MPLALIEGAFVQRQELAERLVDIFEQSARTESKHHVLLVGPRGIGKSHLVSLVYHRLKAKEELGEKFCVAYLKEDEWGITSYLDLLLRILLVICEEEDLKVPASISELSKLSRSQAEDQVWRDLRDVLGTKTLFLIVENLATVFEKIEDHGQKQWRALMQTYPHWAILASTPALFSGISRQVSPFYGFFEVIHLQPLSFTDALALLQKLAHLNNDEKTTALLDTAVGRARVRAVQHIAGGNHRIFVLFYDFLHQSGSAHFVEPLLKTIDALTPYYQSHLEKLSPQQQKIVNFLCEHRRPATVTTIATSCFATHQTAAGQLKQLLNNRYVRVDRIGREAYYELTEPLLRICVEAKTHHERPLHLLVDFIRYWFSRDELERRLSGTGEHDPNKSYFLAALKEYDVHDAHTHPSPEIAALCRALSESAGTREQLRTQAEELAELSRVLEDWVHYARAMTWLGRGAETVPTLEKRLEKEPDNVDLLRSLASAHANAGEEELAEQILDRAMRLAPNVGMLLLDKGELLRGMGRYHEALDAFEQGILHDPDLTQISATSRARLQIKVKAFEAAREILRPYLAEGRTIRGIFFLYGLAFAKEGNAKEAAVYFHKAAKAFGNDSVAWGNEGIALCTLGMYEEAIEPLNRSLTLDPTHKEFLHYRCEAWIETNQHALAVGKASPEDLSHNIFHQLLKISNLHPKQRKLQGRLLKLQAAHSSEIWQRAFVGGLTEFTSFVADRDGVEGLEVWNSALHELYANDEKFAILLKLFDVLTRVRVFNDTKALLELPLEQRSLLLKEGTSPNVN
jgi:tetratricopeptide (TPR) repeat protein